MCPAFHFKEEVPTDLFASWGRKVEEQTPLSEVALAAAFDSLCREMQSPPAADAGRAADDDAHPRLKLKCLSIHVEGTPSTNSTVLFA
eukprot:313472-Amphidinium_carterae.1